ncbi:unnamed protein product, partial [marine sediment metagenome]
FTLSFSVPTNGDLIYVDAAMVSPREELFDYVPGIYDLIADDDLIDLYTGEVFDYDWTNQKIRIITRDMASLRHRKIPIKKLDGEYLAAISKAWSIPPRNLGRPIPMTYGNFDVSPKAAIGTARLTSPAAALGLLVNWDGDGTGGDEIRVIFDRPDGVQKLNACTDIFAFDEDGQQLVHQYFDDRTSPDYCLQEFIDDKD